MDEHFFAAEPADTVADMVFLAFAEKEAGRVEPGEIIHVFFSFFPLWYR